LPQVTDALYVLKPAVLGIIAAGIIKLGRAAIRNFFLAILLVGAFAAMRFAGINFLLILLIAGLLNLIAENGSPLFRKAAPPLPAEFLVPRWPLFSSFCRRLSLFLVACTTWKSSVKTARFRHSSLASAPQS